MNLQPRRIVVGISGASGVVYGIRMLEALGAARIETHLVMSRAAETTLAYETELKVRDVRALADHVHSQADIGAPCSSGSFPSDGMIVAPCSMKSLAEIANGVTSTLLTRSAEVVLKERRRLVLMVRETPLTNTHLRNMLAVSEMGGIIAPPVPAFYAKPNTIEDMVDHSVGRVLDLFGVESDLVRRWKDAEGTSVSSGV